MTTLSLNLEFTNVRTLITERFQKRFMNLIEESVKKYYCKGDHLFCIDGTLPEILFSVVSLLFVFGDK